MTSTAHSTEWPAIFHRIELWMYSSGNPDGRGPMPASASACRRAMSIAVTLADIHWPLISMKQDGKGGIVIEGQCVDQKTGVAIRNMTKEFRIEPDGSAARFDMQGGNVWQRTQINKPLAA
jgi:hypothetical protein